MTIRAPAAIALARKICDPNASEEMIMLAATLIMLDVAEDEAKQKLERKEAGLRLIPGGKC